jgi:exopolysaccharide production protein ExoQ
MLTRHSRTLLVALGLVVLTNGLVFYVNFRLLAQPTGWEAPFVRQIFVAVALASVAAVLLDPLRTSARLGRQSTAATVAILWFASWTVASSLWSLSPDITRGRSLIYIGLAAFAWVIADLSFAQFRRALTLAMAACVAASLVAVVLSDSVGLDRNDDWRGIFTNRNSLAPVAGVAILIGVSLMLDRRRRPLIVGAVLLFISLVVMLGSGSRTAWLATGASGSAAALVVFARVGWDRFGREALVAAGGMAAAGGMVAVVAANSLWNESTFIQRRKIWSLVWDRIGDRPLHGHGWFNVWGVPEFTSADPLLQKGSAHGSFLEVWLGLGLIGLVPFLVIVGLALYGTVTDAWRRPSVATWTWLALVLFLIVENLTESFVLWFSYNWVLLMVAALRSGVGWRRRVDDQTRPALQAASA